MKKTNSLLRIGLVGLFLFFTATTFAQDPIPTVTPPIESFGGLNVGTYNDGEGAVITSTSDAIIFYQVGQTSITLEASPTDENGLAFDLYAWYKITNANGTEGAAIENEIGQTLTYSNLQPGFHRFRVYGIVESSSGTDCNSNEFQDIVIFVLNTLDPSAQTAVDAVLQFCIADNIDDGNINTTITFDSAYGPDELPKPGVEGFQYTYRYYAVKDGDTNTQIPLGEITANGNTNTFILDYNELKTNGIGIYTFFVEVSYSDNIKDNTGKAYAVWTEQIYRDGVAYSLEITPQPGRPTITIIDSSDGV